MNKAKKNISWVYTRDRSEFGRYPNFKAEGPIMLYNEGPNEFLRKTNVRLSPLCMGTQINQLWGVHKIETDRVPYKRRNEHHDQGGWPKEVNAYDVSMTLRFAKKLEKDETLINFLPELYQRCYVWLIQNTSINIYEPYIRKGIDLTKGLGSMSCRKLNVFNDMTDLQRPCVNISFSCDGRRFASSYDDLLFQNSKIRDTFSFLWSLENPNDVDMVLDAETPCIALEFNPKDYWALAGGLKTGQVCYWDVRRGSRPVTKSPFFDSFRDPVTCLKWTSSKTGMEIFSASTDGQIKWWDLRNLESPTEVLVVDLKKRAVSEMKNTVGISCLEFEHTMPTRYLVGTESGQILVGNRKAKSPQERVNQLFQTNTGPVLSIERNPHLLKIIITCGEWSVKLYTEDFKESCIMWSKHCESPLTAVAWCPTRFSSFFVARKDGFFEAWDLIDRTDKPVIAFKASTSALRSMCVHPNGYLIAVGNDNGTVNLLEVSKHFTFCDKADKTALSSMLERESRREKLLESKMRELRLKARTKGEQQEGEGMPVRGEGDIIKAEYLFQQILNELNTTGLLPKKDKKLEIEY